MEEEQHRPVEQYEQPDLLSSPAPPLPQDNYGARLMRGQMGWDESKPIGRNPYDSSIGPSSSSSSSSSSVAIAMTTSSSSSSQQQQQQQQQHPSTPSHSHISSGLNPVFTPPPSHMTSNSSITTNSNDGSNGNVTMTEGEEQHQHHQGGLQNTRTSSSLQQQQQQQQQQYHHHHHHASLVQSLSFRLSSGGNNGNSSLSSGVGFNNNFPSSTSGTSTPITGGSQGRSLVGRVGVSLGFNSAPPSPERPVAPPPSSTITSTSGSHLGRRTWSESVDGHGSNTPASGLTGPPLGFASNPTSPAASPVIPTSSIRFGRHSSGRSSTNTSPSRSWKRGRFL